MREKGNESHSVAERNLQAQGDLSGKVLRGTVACGQVSSVHSHPELDSRVQPTPMLLSSLTAPSSSFRCNGKTLDIELYSNLTFA